MKDTGLHGLEPPSPWVKRWSHLIEPGGPVLDVACGHGRHVRWFLQQGHRVTAVDRAEAAMDSITDGADNCEKLLADIENGPWPLAGRRFAAVVVTNYLWRPLLPDLLTSLAPGGVLIYETFSHGNETVGKPSRPDFLLRPGELIGLCNGLRIVGFEDGFLRGGQSGTAGNPRFVQRIVAVREASENEALQAPGGKDIPRYALD